MDPKGERTLGVLTKMVCSSELGFQVGFTGFPLLRLVVSIMLTPDL